MNSWKRRLWCIVLGGSLASIGCEDQSETMRKRVSDRIWVESASWETAEGRNRHEFTLVNGNDLAVKDVVIRFHYFDRQGAELGTADATFPPTIDAHDSVRKMNVETTPPYAQASRVTYEIKKVRTVWKRKKY